jgi:hypothetical protein
VAARRAGTFPRYLATSSSLRQNGRGDPRRVPDPARYHELDDQHPDVSHEIGCALGGDFAGGGCF